jgi:beta-lactamase regulating signal transducer with metallopeptidase domain
MIELLNHIARLWWDRTASMSWQVGLLVLLIGCIDLLTRKWAWPQLRYALWSLILVKLILPPSLSLPSGVVPELRPRVAQVLQWMNSDGPPASEKSAAISDCGLRIADSTLGAGPQFRGFAVSEGGIVKIEDLGDGRVAGFQPAIRGRDALDTRRNDTPQPAPAANPQSAIVNPQLDWQFYAMMIWLSGTLILGIWLFFRLHTVAGRHGYQAAAASLPRSFYNHLADCAMRLGLRRIPRVVVTKRLTSPAVFGVFSPVLLVPKGYLSKLSRRDTEHMLLHELAHIKRGDLVMHGLYLLLQIVYWYNPLLWLVRRHLHHLRELSCDGTVAELLRERTPAYRQTLLETARRLLTTSVEPGLGLLGLFEDSNYLLVRLNWLTKPTWRYKTMKRVTVATIAVLMFACVLPMAQGQQAVPPQDITHVSSNQAVPIQTESDNPQAQDQLSQQIAALQAQLQQLVAQQQELQKQLNALNPKRQPSETAERRRETARRLPGESYEIYTVQEGDSLASIARKFYGTGAGENVTRIAQANQDRLKGQDALRTGQELRIPVLPNTSEGTRAQTDRARRVKELMERAKAYQKQQQYEASLGQLEALLALDPHNDEALTLKQMVEDIISLRQQIQVRDAPKQVPSTLEEVRRKLDDEVARVQREVKRAQAQAALDQLQQRLTQSTQAYGDQMQKWSQSDEMKKWQEDMAKWGQKMEQWGQELGRQQAAAVNGAASDAAPREMPPMPAMPPMPPMPAMPPVSVHVSEVPTPPVPPQVRQNASGLEEAVTHAGFGAIPGDKPLELVNPVGSVVVRSGDGWEYVIRATVTGRAETQERAHEIAERLVTLTQSQDNGVERITVSQPQGLSNRESAVVNLEVTAPRDVRIKIRQTAGDIRLTGLRGSVDASAKVGSIQATDVAGQIVLNTDVGSIEFTAPKDFSAKVQAKANMGSIQSDLPLEVVKPRGPATGSSASGTIGGGDGELSLKTNVGSIRIRSQSAEPRRAERSRPEPKPRPEPRGEF